jgi:hypothetical protein
MHKCMVKKLPAWWTPRPGTHRTHAHTPEPRRTVRNCNEHRDLLVPNQPVFSRLLVYINTSKMGGSTTPLRVPSLGVPSHVLGARSPPPASSWRLGLLLFFFWRPKKAQLWLKLKYTGHTSFYNVQRTKENPCKGLTTHSKTLSLLYHSTRPAKEVPKEPQPK